MSKPAFVKLGGSVLTDKTKEGNFRRAVARRLLTEIDRSEVPTVLFHGAGGFGHPPAERAGLGRRPIHGKGLDGLCDTLAAVTRLHAEVLQLAAAVGLRPMPIPLHLTASQQAGELDGLPVQRILAFVQEGFTPVLHGTVVRDDELGWTVVSADRLMAELAADLAPRLAVFATDVPGVMDGDRLIPAVLDPDDVPARSTDGRSPDVTGAMQAKVHAGLALARYAPTLVLDGTVRGRLLDALRGKSVPCTRLGDQ